MKKMFLLSLMALSFSNQAHAQAVWGTISVPSSQTIVSAPVVHNYSYKFSFTVASLEKKQINAYVTIYQDKKALCVIQEEPALLTLDAQKTVYTCEGKKLRIGMYRGIMGGTWFTVELGSNGSADNLLDKERELNVTWPVVEKPASSNEDRFIDGGSKI